MHSPSRHHTAAAHGQGLVAPVSTGSTPCIQCSMRTAFHTMQQHQRPAARTIYCTSPRHIQAEYNAPHECTIAHRPRLLTDLPASWLVPHHMGRFCSVPMVMPTDPLLPSRSLSLLGDSADEGAMEMGSSDAFSSCVPSADASSSDPLPTLGM
mmetsp:Transcript_30682/g.78386  ORF Transcript_30682/g.78386 Transcript_30682/m.78386 type:complete len:153 (+) Transcript_30682:402-860(+)